MQSKSLGGQAMGAIVFMLAAAGAFFHTVFAVADQSRMHAAKTGGAYLSGIVANQLTGSPLAGVHVELAEAVKALDHVVTDAEGRFHFPTPEHPNSVTEGGFYDLTFVLDEFKPGVLNGVQASTDSANVLLKPLGVTTPERPIARSGPHSVYLEWPANPEYNVKGYNVWRTEVQTPPASPDCETYTPAPLGETVKVNGVPGDVYDGLVQGTEFIDDSAQSARYYIYQIQAISGGDRPSELSPASCPPVKGDFLTIFFPNVFVQHTGLYLWELIAAAPPYARIPISSRCAYNVSTSGMQIVATLPTTIVSPQTTRGDVFVTVTGVTAAMAGAFDYNIVASLEPDALELRIASATTTGRSLYGAGDLFNVYVRTLSVPDLNCGPLHLAADQGDGNGVRVYDDSPSPQPIELELVDGTLCKAGGCLHGDVNLDGVVDMADASEILKIWVKKNPPPAMCWPGSGDINRDGYADSADSTLIQRWLAGLPIAPTAAKSGYEGFSFAVEDNEKDTATVQVLAGNVVGQPGQTVLLPVTIVNGAPAAGFDMMITFPSGDTGLAYVEESAAPGPGLAGFEMISFSGTADSNGGGWVSVSASGMEPAGKAGAITLATLRFQIGADAAGTIPVVLSSFNVSDAYGFEPRQTSPKAPDTYDGSVTLGNGILTPNVTGQPLAAAQSALVAAGLAAGAVDEQFSATVAAGVVISQDPIAGVSVAGGSEVDLVVSKGPEPTTVPNVVGMTREAAETAIAAARLVVGTVVSQYSETAAPGTVIAQNPEGGSQAIVGGSVNLTVASAQQNATVPNVVGLTQEEAQEELAEEGLAVGTITEAYSATVPAGVVISQDPAAGVVRPTGSPVALTVSLGIGMGTVTVTINPAAVRGMALWRVDDSPNWHYSGESATVPMGSHTLSFSDISATAGGCFSPATNWIKPGPIAISVVVGDNALTATYQAAAGKQAAGGDLLLLAFAASALLAASRRKQT